MMFAGVWLGKDCSEFVWIELVAKLRKGPYLIQKFIPQEAALVMDGNDCLRKPMTTVLSLPVIRGKATGLSARSSEFVICNEMKGGFTRPCYVVDNN